MLRGVRHRTRRPVCRRYTNAAPPAPQGQEFSWFDAFKGALSKRSSEIIKNQTPLERSLTQRNVIDASVSGKLGLLPKILFSVQKYKTRENICSVIIYERISAQAHAPEFKGTSMPATFATWARLAFLHMWLVDFRFRYIQNSFQRDRMTKKIIDQCWTDIEAGIADTTGSRNPLLLSKYSKQYLNFWQGAALAYDVGTIKGDTSLAESIWRNLYEQNTEVPITEIVKLVEYVRQEQEKLMQVSDLDFTSGDFTFSRPPFEIPESERLAMSKESIAQTADMTPEMLEKRQIELRSVPKWKSPTAETAKEEQQVHDVLKVQYHKVLERQQPQQTQATEAKPSQPAQQAQSQPQAQKQQSPPSAQKQQVPPSQQAQQNKGSGAPQQKWTSTNQQQQQQTQQKQYSYPQQQNQGQKHNTNSQSQQNQARPYVQKTNDSSQQSQQQRDQYSHQRQYSNSQQGRQSQSQRWQKPPVTEKKEPEDNSPLPFPKVFRPANSPPQAPQQPPPKNNPKKEENDKNPPKQ